MTKIVKVFLSIASVVALASEAQAQVRGGFSNSRSRTNNGEWSNGRGDGNWNRGGGNNGRGNGDWNRGGDNNGRGGGNNDRGDRDRGNGRGGYYQHSQMFRNGGGGVFQYLEAQNMQPLRWNSQVNGYKGQEEYVLVFQNYVHPGGGGNEVIVRFTAPQSGRVRVSTPVADGDGKCGNGAVFYLKFNHQVINSYVIRNQDSRGTTINETMSVRAGDTIDFAVNATLDGNGFNECDSTILDPTVEYVGGGDRW